ncbi:MAG: hypothetical protein AB8C95_11200 [Phycisphaeraceae bacterium]
MPITRIALVGHCGFDSGSLSRFASNAAPDAEVVRVNDQKSLDDVANADTLLLVNRVLDGRFTVGGSGIELIKTIAAQADAPPTMLISNFAESQEEAVAAGALPGFGKSQVGDAAMKQRIADAVTG